MPRHRKSERHPPRAFIKLQDDGRYWVHDHKGVYDGPFQLRSDAQCLADALNREYQKVS